MSTFLLPLLARAATLVATLTLVSGWNTVTAQGFNVDLYADGASPAPSAAFAAASGQVGTWNAISCTFCEPQVFPLVDVNGQASSVSLRTTLGGVANACPSPSMSPDEAALLGGGQGGSDAQNAVTFALQGLPAGTYDLYAYVGPRCLALGPSPVRVSTWLDSGVATPLAGVQEQFVEGSAPVGVTFQERGNFARFRFQVASGQRLSVNFVNATSGAFNAHGIQLVPVVGAVVPLCFGTNESPNGCPCGIGTWGRGCASSFQSSGAALVGSGVPSVAADALVLSADGVSDSVVTFFQGTTLLGGGSGIVFGDGQRCAGGALVRIASKLASGGQATYPVVGELPISVKGFVSSGGARYYQVRYRDSFPGFCSADTFNSTNAVAVSWSP